MHPDQTAKPGHSSAEGSEKSTRSFDKEVRDMVNAITHSVTGLSHHKTAAGGREELEDHHQHHQVMEDEKGGARIITLAGTNTGATMRSELGDQTVKAKSGGDDQDEEEDDDEGTKMGTFVNSNFQAVNNSIMFGSSYSTNDPGVHLHISETFEHQAQHNRKQQQQQQQQHGIKKGKRHEKEAGTTSSLVYSE